MENLYLEGRASEGPLMCICFCKSPALVTILVQLSAQVVH